MTHQASAPLLESRDLRKTFGHGEHAVDAVRPASFALQPGEILAVVGESGSGKTTLARLLLRLLEPTGGQILLDQQDVSRLSHKAYWRRVQAVFQDPFASFNQFFRVGTLLEQALHIVDDPMTAADRRARINDALEAVGLKPSEVLGKWPHEFSGGQRQRIMIARALLVRPELLIADEPTSMLDASLRATILNLLLDLRKRHGMGIIFITHDIGQATYISDRILVMYRGEMVEQGPAEQVLWAPQHPYTVRLMSDVPKLKGRTSLQTAPDDGRIEPTTLEDLIGDRAITQPSLRRN
jgi:peptide/nickel transport system ATP-binding protein